MTKYVFELAEASDDRELRSLLASTPIPGGFTVGFCREPSYFKAAAVEGEFRQTLVARETTSGRIVAAGSRSIGLRFFNGTPTSIGYLSGLRIVPQHRNRGLLARGYSFLRELHTDGRTAAYLTTIADDNRAAIALLTSRRAGLPAYHDLGRYHTLAFALDCRGQPASERRGLSVRSATLDDMDEMLGFVQAVGPKRQFFPCYQEKDFSASDGRLQGLQPHDLLLAFRDGRLVGMLGAWDQRALRQTVIHRYGAVLGELRPLINVWSGVRGLPKLPPPGTILDYVSAAIPLTREDNPDVLVALFGAMRDGKCGHGRKCLLIGMYETDPLLPVLAKWRSWRYTTRVFLAHWEDGEALRESLDGRPIYLELGSL